MKYIFALYFTICLSSLSAAIAPQTTTLGNGLKVVVLKNPIMPSVNVLTVYEVGTADDPADMVGLSHMLEHMMFKGTPQYPDGEIDKLINRLGGSPLNAVTSWDNTVYTLSVPAQYLETVLDIEADRMQNLNFSNEIFLSEQKVVMAERQMRLGNHPLRTSAEACQRAMYMAHPYGIFPIGFEAHIEAYTQAALMEHYRKWYVPNNATIIVIGPYDLSHVLPIIEEKFGKLDRQDSPTHKRVPEPEREGVTTTIEQENSRAENIYISIKYRAPTLITKPEEYMQMHALLATLFGSDSKVLYKKMVKEKHLALEVSGSYECGKDDMCFNFILCLEPGMSTEAAENLLFTQLQKFLQHGLPEKDFMDAKQEQLNNFAFAMDGDYFLMWGADLIARGFPIEAISKYEQLIKNVTIHQAHAMLAMVLTKPPVLIARNYPKGKMPKRNYQKVLKQTVH